MDYDAVVLISKIANMNLNWFYVSRSIKDCHWFTNLYKKIVEFCLQRYYNLFSRTFWSGFRKWVLSAIKAEVSRKMTQWSHLCGWCFSDWSSMIRHGSWSWTMRDKNLIHQPWTLVYSLFLFLGTSMETTSRYYTAKVAYPVLYLYFPRPPFPSYIGCHTGCYVRFPNT